MHFPRPLVLSSLLCATLAAQSRKFTEVVVTTAGENEFVGSMPSYQKAIAQGLDGNWWLAIARSTKPADGSPGVATAELWRSPDGMRWEKGAVLPGTNSGSVAIVADPTAPRLHALWAAASKEGFGEPWYQAYDLATSKWEGEPVRLAEATAAEDQYFPIDLERAQDGTLVAAFGSHRAPKGKAWNCGWSMAVRARRANEAKWSDTLQANVASYGIGGGLWSLGTRVEGSYRTCPFDAIVGMRTFDTKTLAFVQAEDQNVSGPLEGSLGIANSSVNCVDTLGGRYVLHVVGDLGPGQGRLRLAYAAPESEAFTCFDLVEDPPLVRGNESYGHFALARGPGNQVLAFYGRAEESFARLHQRVLDAGETIGAAKVVAEGKERAFASLSGNEQATLRPGVQLVATRAGEGFGGGSVVVYGVLPSPAAPRKASAELPRK